MSTTTIGLSFPIISHREPLFTHTHQRWLTIVDNHWLVINNNNHYLPLHTIANHHCPICHSFIISHHYITDWLGMVRLAAALRGKFSMRFSSSSAAVNHPCENALAFTTVGDCWWLVVYSAVVGREPAVVYSPVNELRRLEDPPCFVYWNSEF